MRYAVVFKTYTWDGFVHRQASRCKAAAGRGDFFISVDETNGSVGPIAFDRVVRVTNDKIVASGFANRFEKGSLLWWNPDYVHYQFQEAYPDYDFYVFIEYDAVVQGQIETLIDQVAESGTDLVAFPIQMAKQDWFWTPFHRQTYELEDLQGALICMTVFSRRALEMLAARRRAMTKDGQVRYWPNAEVFVATEITRAKFKSRSLAEFGDVDAYQWFPPILEDDLQEIAGMAFLHPVLDRRRYVSALLKTTTQFRSFLYPRSKMWLALRRFPKKDYMPGLAGAARKRFFTSMGEKAHRSKLRMAARVTFSRSSKELSAQP